MNCFRFLFYWMYYCNVYFLINPLYIKINLLHGLFLNPFQRVSSSQQIKFCLWKKLYTIRKFVFSACLATCATTCTVGRWDTLISIRCSDYSVKDGKRLLSTLHTPPWSWSDFSVRSSFCWFESSNRILFCINT